MTLLRYAAVACQTDLPCPRDRSGIGPAVGQMLSLVDRVVLGYSPFAPVKLIVFPEFSHAAPVYFTAADLLEHLAVSVPNEHLERYLHKAREHDVYIQTGTFLERDDRWPGHVFNTTWLVGP